MTVSLLLDSHFCAPPSTLIHCVFASRLIYLLILLFTCANFCSSFGNFNRNQSDGVTLTIIYDDFMFRPNVLSARSQQEANADTFACFQIMFYLKKRILRAFACFQIMFYFKENILHHAYILYLVFWSVINNNRLEQSIK